MRPYIKPVLITLILCAAGYMLWPFIHANISLVKATLIDIKKFCLSHTWQGYLVYTTILSVILFAGLPLASAAMLLAGVIYGFWEAVTLVTLCRLLTAAFAFFIVRRLLNCDGTPHKRAPYLIRKFEKHPTIGLLLARLSPLPDSVVNYTAPVTPIHHTQYMIVSLIGMIPLTLLCVWAGGQLGSVAQLIRWLQ